jgi:SAM-dependent methyltransferase
MRELDLRKEFIKEIKSKKELSGLADSLVLSQLNEFLNKNHLRLLEKSEKEKKIILKEVRSKLRLLAGRFQRTLKNKEKILNSNKIDDLLKTHSSTSERFEFYPILKRILNKMKFKSILDLGCGLNPIALASKYIEYYASDINAKDLEIISNYFQKNKINGKTFILDITKINVPLPKTDVCLMLKLLDVVDPKHNLSEKILKQIPSKTVIVSFATKKLSGKKMNFPKRFWFEKLLKKLCCSFETWESENEIFYLIKKP